MSTDTGQQAHAPWAKPQPVTQLELAFPAAVTDRMPTYEEIPASFKTGAGPWVDLQRDWFFHGLTLPVEFRAKDGVDAEAAYRHLAMIQGSYEPKHEHKEAAVAYLASLWFTEVHANGKVYKDEVPA